MIPNASILSSPPPHTGMSYVIFVNSHSFFIHIKGLCLSKSPHYAVILFDVWCVSSLHKNLLSIKKFTFDINSICILDSFGFVIKAK